MSICTLQEKHRPVQIGAMSYYLVLNCVNSAQKQLLSNKVN